jgi:hypothetical protein
MKKFLFRILIFCMLFFILDKAFILVRNRVPNLEVDQRLEKVINGKLNADIYILGSSRGARNIVAKQIEDELGLSTYNLSYPGSNVDFHEYLLQEILHANKKPQKIILAVDDYYELIAFESSIKFRFDRLYPLVAYPRVQNELIERGEKNIILSNLFILHQLNRSNFTFRPKLFSKNDSIFEHGSMHMSYTSPKFDRVYNNKDDINKYPIERESQMLREKFLRIIDVCQVENIELTLCFSPNFKRSNTAFENRMKSLAGDDVLYMHYDTSSTKYRDPELFVDSAHLKLNGAKIFTNELIAFLRRNR